MVMQITNGGSGCHFIVSCNGDRQSHIKKTEHKRRLSCGALAPLRQPRLHCLFEVDVPS